ncbi:hypothetical protein GCM10022140_57260 [Rhodococcus aetherivorans]
MSSVTCQNVPKGSHRMPGSTSGPSGSRNQSGSRSSSANDHRVIGLVTAGAYGLCLRHARILVGTAISRAVLRRGFPGRGRVGSKMYADRCLREV